MAYTNETGFSGNTHYLDQFTEDCYTYRKAHNKAVRRKKQIGTKMIVFIMGVIFFTIIGSYIFDNKKITALLCILLFGMIVTALLYVILSNTFRSASSSEEDVDKINYKFVNLFLQRNNLGSLDCFGGSFCVNTGLAVSKKRKSATLTSLLMICIIAACIFYLYQNFNSNTGIFRQGFPTAYALLAACGALFLFYTLFRLIKYIFKRIQCYKKVDAVCIDVKSKSFQDSEGDSRTEYKPIYYVKHNEHGYVLFDNTWSTFDIPTVGDIRSSFYINPNNPLNYCESVPLITIILNVIVCIMCMVPIYMFFLKL